MTESRCIHRDTLRAARPSEHIPIAIPTAAMRARVQPPSQLRPHPLRRPTLLPGPLSPIRNHLAQPQRGPQQRSASWNTDRHRDYSHSYEQEQEHEHQRRTDRSKSDYALHQQNYGPYLNGSPPLIAAPLPHGYKPAPSSSSSSPSSYSAAAPKRPVGIDSSAPLYYNPPHTAPASASTSSPASSSSSAPYVYPRPSSSTAPSSSSARPIMHNYAHSQKSEVGSSEQRFRQGHGPILPPPAVSFFFPPLLLLSYLSGCLCNAPSPRLLSSFLCLFPVLLASISPVSAPPTLCRAACIHTRSPLLLPHSLSLSWPLSLPTHGYTHTSTQLLSLFCALRYFFFSIHGPYTMRTPPMCTSMRDPTPALFFFFSLCILFLSNHFSHHVHTRGAFLCSRLQSHL